MARTADTTRFVAYNILEGGMGRLDPIYETLAYLRGDIVGLCEANDVDAVGYLAAKLDCDHVVAESPSGQYHVALLCSGPIEQMVNLGVAVPSLDRAAMEAIVQVNGTSWRVVVVHLFPGTQPEDEARRLREMEQVLGNLGTESLPTVLLGDFNAGAPYHPLDPSNLAPHRRERLEARGGAIDHDLVRSLNEGGWVDAYHRCHAENPAHTFTTGFPAQRVDYIFLSPDLAPRLVDADVEQGGFAPYCSDHFPLWAAIGPQAA
ncbi:MAG: endonuclease/exonuclease/phosphatase family protein [Phycisphaerae bacterium]|nr:endonuclease/exonuclease/phosphatase family protein [Phycisphaerae bacterium]